MVLNTKGVLNSYGNVLSSKELQDVICSRVFLYDKTNIRERKRLGDQKLIKK